MEKKGPEKAGIKGNYFITMPAEAIESLRMELTNLLGEKLASGVMFRFGYRCGEALVEQREEKKIAEGQLEKTLQNIWDRTGLGKILEMRIISENEVVVDIVDSPESTSSAPHDGPICDLTRGYLAGITNTVTKRKYYCVEMECMSLDSKKCRFNLVEFPHKVYIGKSHENGGPQ